MDVWTFLFACLLLAGCGLHQPPRLAVRDVEVTDRTAEAVVLRVLLDIENPNSEPVELHQFNYTFSVGGAAAYTGRSAAQATIGPRLTTQVAIPAVVRHDQAPGAAGADYGVTGRLTYTAPGFFAQAMLDLGLPRPAVGFTGRGRLEELAGSLPAAAAHAEARQAE